MSTADMTRSQVENASILIVDEDHWGTHTVCTALSEAGYEVELAPTSTRALNLAKGQLFHLAMVNLRAIDGDAPELLRGLYQALPDLELVIVADRASCEDIAQATNHEAAACITEPLDPRKAVSAVDDVLSNRHPPVETQELYPALMEEPATPEDTGVLSRVSEETYRSLVDACPDGFMTLDLEGRITFASRRALDIHGYELPEEMLGSNASTLVTAERRDGFMRTLQDVRKSGAAKDVHCALLRKDGVRFEGDLSVVLLRHLSGDPKAYLVISREGRERTDVTQELRRSDEEKRRLLAAVHSILVGVGPGGRVTYWNKTAETVFGLAASRAVGRPFHRIQVDWDWDKVSGGIAVCQAESKPVRVDDIPYVRTDGTEGYLGITLSPIPAEVDGQAGFLLVGADITERKSLRAELSQGQKLQSIGRLAGGIAHDFNNILMTIILYTEMVMEEPLLPRKLKPDLECVLQEANDGARLVRQILDFGRRSHIEPRDIDLRPLIGESVSILRRTLPVTIKLHVQLGSERVMLKADPARIQQVVMNLVTNARDAMPRGGEVRIGLARTTVGADEQPPVLGMTAGHWVCLVVSDTGSGIPAEVMPHLFEPFATSHPKGEGMGLGLAQVYGIVKQHGGHISVETQPGHGTVFRVFLPAEQTGSPVPPVRERTTTAPIPAKASGETVLLVEDEELVRMSTQKVLESLGYYVLTATNGREALEVHGSGQAIDLVLTDVVMPQMGGRELIIEIRKRDPKLKAVIMTGHALDMESQWLRDQGISNLVHKPLDRNTLAQVVREALGPVSVPFVEETRDAGQAAHPGH